MELVALDDDEDPFIPYADNHGSDTGARFLQGRKVLVEFKPTADAEFEAFTPKGALVEGRSIWVRRGDITGDFAALALTAGGDIESIANKTVQLETSYSPDLEDLDTQITYGTDADGIPIVWRITGTTRASNSMVLDLAAALI